MERPLERVKLEAQYYDEVFQEARLDMETDGVWMSSLAKCEFDDNWLAYVNKVVGIGSADMRTVAGDLDPAIKEARREFFEDVLGWGDETHPAHESYLEAKKLSTTLPPIANFIATQRVLATRDFDALSLITTHSRLINTRAENMEQRLACLEANGLKPKTIMEGSRYVFFASTDGMKKVCRTLSAIEGLDYQRVIHASPMLLIVDPKTLKRRLQYALSEGIAMGAINKNGTILNMSSEKIKQRIDFFHSRGIKAARTINLNWWALTSSEELLDARIKGIEDMGLDPAAIINGNPALLSSETSMVRSRFLLAKSILRYYGASSNVEETVSNQPMLLSRKKLKMRSTVRILDDVVDKEYMAKKGAASFDHFAMKPLDIIFATVADQKISGNPTPDGITPSEVRKMDKRVPAHERRSHNLELLQDKTTRDIIGKRAINAYLAYQPLTEKEVANYPELADLAKSR